MGAWMASFPVSLQIWDLTPSSLAVGALGLVQAVPAVVVGLLGGSLADAMDRKRLVLVHQQQPCGVGDLRPAGIP